MKTAPFVLALIACVQLHAQSTFSELDVTASNAVAPGYYLLAPNSPDSLGFIDHAGKSVFRMNTGTVTNFQSYRNEYVTYYSSIWQSSTGCFVRRDRNLSVVDSFFLQGNYVVDFHEGRVWSDTSYMILGTERRTVDMSQLHPGGRPDATVLGAIIQERKFNGEVIFEWKSLDYISVTEATEEVDLTSPLIDYIHVNSIEHTADGNIIISCRHLDEVVKINAVNGQIIWRLGGSESKNSTFTIANDTFSGFTGFSHQHSAIETSRGTILLFDNGNLKPLPKVSRAVEYDLDLTSYTATKVWEHVPQNGRHSTAMGSVQELVNGNILVNYGATEGDSRLGVVIAEEVSRAGVVVATIKNTDASEVTSYRVMKSTFGMAGCYNLIVAPDTLNVSCDDSTTYVGVEVVSTTRPTGIVVERHNYQPHNITFLAESYCGVIPLRWVVKIEDSLSLKGAMWFNTSEISAIEQADKLQLLYRPTEGQGPFAVVSPSYNAALQSFRVGKLISGEFMIAYRECLEPAPSTPANAATEISVSPTLVWQAAAINDGYELDVSTARSFATYNRCYTRRLDTTISNLKLATTYYWRVRRVFNGFTKGPWSGVFQFTTHLGVPIPISPVLQKDTVAIDPTPTFRWSKAEGAERYRVIVTDVALEQPIVNEATSADSLVLRTPLLYNTAYMWTVSAMKGTTTGRPSQKQFIITIPSTPELLTPTNDTLIPHTPSQYVSWTASSGAMRYAVTLMKTTPRSVIKRDTTTALWAVLSDIPQKTELGWTVQAISRYGPGRVSNMYRFNTYSTQPLIAPVTLSPKNVDNIDATDPVLLKWSTVKDATSYRIQTTSGSDFHNALRDTIVSETQYSEIGLRPGTTYSWRVMASTEHVISPWSDTARFITAPTAATVLVPVWPRMSSADVPTSGIVRYSTSPSYIRYDAEFSRSSDFSDIDLTFPSTSSSCNYAQLQEQTKYFWRVVGVRSSGVRDTGTYSQFTTAYETVSVENEPTQSSVNIAGVQGGIAISAQSSVHASYRVVNMLGQDITSGVIGPGTTMVDIPENQYVFVQISFVSEPSAMLLYKVLIH